MSEYKLSKKATQHLKEIYKQGYTDFGEVQADKYFNALCERFSKIAEHPLFYPTVYDIREGYRRSICGKHSIYYRLNHQETVEIIAILKYQDVLSYLE